MSFLKRPWTHLCYTLSMSSLPLPSSFRASPSLAASSTWANISAIRASSSLFLTLYTSSSCFLHTNTTGSGYSWQLQLPVNSHWNSIQQMVCFFFVFSYRVTPYGRWDFWTEAARLSLGDEEIFKVSLNLDDVAVTTARLRPFQICCWDSEFKVEASISRTGS